MIKQSILIVDDDALICAALQVNLQRAGFNTAIAESGKAALKLLAEQSYDLLLTDYFMPGINGLVLMQQAKKLYPKMRVIIFSGFRDRSIQEKFLQFGADDFLNKPLKFNDLLKRIQNILPPLTAAPQ